jgi:hypothetical protein
LEHTDLFYQSELTARAKNGILAFEDLGRDRARVRTNGSACQEKVEMGQAIPQLMGLDRNAHLLSPKAPKLTCSDGSTNDASASRNLQ